VFTVAGRTAALATARVFGGGAVAPDRVTDRKGIIDLCGEGRGQEGGKAEKKNN